MRKIIPTPFGKVSFCLFLFVLIAYTFYACQKPEHEAKKMAVSVSKNGLGSVADSSLTIIQGPCPYTCDDPRCANYSQPSADCPPTLPSPDTIAIKQNSNNTQEVVGQTHNNALRAIMPYYNSGTLQPTQQNVFNYTKSFLIRSGYDSATIVNTYNMLCQRGLYRFPNSPNLDSVALLLYNGGNIGITAKNYANRLSTLLNSLNSYTTPTNTIYLNFANQCITYENQIKSDATITANEKNALLAAHSVARFSENYWMNQAIMKSWYNWKSSAGADVAGAVGGAVMGGMAGAVVGGIGAGPGAVLGGCTGGIGNSVQNAAQQIWDHFFN